ncbi:S9 family peptidase [Phenylobacterium sp.]|uniref:S9 family peptidase n=1 Tax=Phenylobacterium sp. TaxID=1871053 RepID=UPI0025D676FD|nr:S9 family peptidase [Phenylobacterium sp.]MCA3722085.1 S9 family peptidase [Phenylobacterium sp.]
MKFAAGVLALALMTGSATAEDLTLERVYAAPDLSGPRARGVALSPDGTLVTYLRARADNPRVTDLWAADVAGGAPRRLIDAAALIPTGRDLSEAEKSRRERQGVQTSGVVAYDWDDEGRFILAPVEGDLWLWTRADGSLRRLTETPEDEVDARVSPKGGFVSFVRGDNLWIAPSGGGEAKALTRDGTEVRSWATPEFIAQEEMDRQTGYWWSPDETRIALTRVDLSGVDVVERFDVNAAGAVIVPQRYPRTGRPNARVELFVAGLDGGAPVAVDLGADPDIYLARVDWSRNGRTLYVQRQSRDQKRLDLLAVDPATGASRVLLTETSPHWVELTDDFRPLKDGSFLWSSERSGWKHLYLYGPDGRRIRQVTRGDWPVDAVQGIDEARGVVLFTANRDTPVERRLYEASWRRAQAPRALTGAGGWWTVKVAGRGGAFVGTYEDPTTPPRTGLYRADGERVRWIEENPLDDTHPLAAYRDRLRTPTYGTLKAADGTDLWWSMRTPPGFDSSRKHPVVVRVYGGPGSAQVRKVWHDPADQLYLQAGFILFSLDNRGTPNRSTAFKTAIDRRLGQLEVDDQIAGARWLAQQPFVDPARIGVTGWSYGGYMAPMLLTAPDTPFAAGVSGAPPTDWTLYDTHYTERYMGKPSENPAGYAASEVTARLGRLKPESLLLIHGMADDNVTFDNATRVMANLQGRGVAFETMVYPGLRHRAGWTQTHLKHRTAATLEFFRRKLGAGR